MKLSHDSNFVKYMEENFKTLHDYFLQYIDRDALPIIDKYGNPIDLLHFSVTLLALRTSMFVPDFWAGWGGDLATVTNDFVRNRVDNSNFQEFADSLIGNDKYSFSLEDICADFDSISIHKLMGSELSTDDSQSFKKLSKFMREFYTMKEDQRYLAILDTLNMDQTATEEQVASLVYNIMTGLLERQVLIPRKAPLASISDFEYTSLSFARFIFSKI